MPKQHYNKNRIPLNQSPLHGYHLAQSTLRTRHRRPIFPFLASTPPVRANNSPPHLHLHGPRSCKEMAVSMTHPYPIPFETRGSPSMPIRTISLLRTTWTSTKRLHRLHHLHIPTQITFRGQTTCFLAGLRATPRVSPLSVTKIQHCRPRVVTAIKDLKGTPCRLILGRHYLQTRVRRCACFPSQCPV